MKITKEQTKIYIERLYCDCDDCGGEMISTDVYFASYPPQYIHKCDLCGYEKRIMGGVKYPRNLYEEALQ